MQHETPSMTHSVPEAARLLGIGKSTLWQKISDGEISVVRLGGRTLITDEAIRDLLQRNTSPARAA